VGCEVGSEDTPIFPGRIEDIVQIPGGMMQAEAVVGQLAVPTGRQRRSTDPAGQRLIAGDPTVKRLTSRERTVALLIAQGLTDYAIAEQLELSLGTVKVCRQRIQRRLQLSSRAEIVAWVTARTTETEPDRLHRVGDRIGTGTDST
jgi:DNA-binding NarL/FixJ family response regulator